MATSTNTLQTQSKKFAKASNTRGITATSTVTGICTTYAPSGNSARLTNLSWQALQQCAKAGKPFTVGQYLKAQAEINPGNTGDALPCLRYWAGNGNIKVTA